MEKLIKCLKLTLEAIDNYLSSNEEELTVKSRLNSLLTDGNFGTRFTKCRFKKVIVPFLKVKGLLCKELKIIVLVGEHSEQQEKVCRARRYTLISVPTKYSIKQLDKQLINNELI